MSLPQERSTAGLVSYTWVARSRSGSSSFTALALNKPSSSSSSSSSFRLLVSSILLPRCAHGRCLLRLSKHAVSFTVWSRDSNPQHWNELFQRLRNNVQANASARPPP